MKLISMELHNFRKYRNASIYFPEGIIGVIGNNGSGKSTLIEAIGWAIYGNRASRTPRAKEQIKRQGATDQDCWVRLRFELKGNTYEVLRIMGKNFSSDGQVKINGRIAATTSTGITKYLEKVIGMDYVSFFTSIVAKQKELNALSDKNPGERKKNMLKMLRIDAIEKAVKKVREDRRERKYLAENLQKMLKNIDEIEKSISNARKEEEDIVSMIDEIQQKIAIEEKKLMEIEEEMKKERKKAEIYNEMMAKKKMLEGKKGEKIERMKEKEREVEKLNHAYMRYEEIKDFAVQYDELKRRKDEMEEIRIKYYKRKDLLSRKLDVETDIENMKKKEEDLKKFIVDEESIINRKKGIDKKIDDIREAILEIEKEMERNRTEMHQMIQEREEIIRKRKEIEKLGRKGKCPMCGRELGDHFEKLMDEFKMQEENIENKVKEIEMLQKQKGDMKAELKNKLSMAEVERNEIEKKLKKIDEIKNRIRYYMEMISKHEEKLRILTDEIEKIGYIEMDEKLYDEISAKLKQLEKFKTEAISLKNEIKRLPLLKEEIKRLEGEINELEKEIDDVKNAIDNINFDKNRYEMIELKYADERNVMEKMKIQKMKLERDLMHIKNEIKRLEEEMEEERKREKKIKDLRKEIANLELLEDLLSKFKNYLISKISPSLSFYASHFFSIFTDGKYDNIEIDDDYNIYIYDGGEKFPINRFSGGEEDLANLSLRLAISELIARRADTSFEFMALDEVFGSQDSERRKNVLKALNELKKQFKQILLITHIEDVKDEMEHVIRVYEDDRGISHAIIE